MEFRELRRRRRIFAVLCRDCRVATAPGYAPPDDGEARGRRHVGILVLAIPEPLSLLDADRRVRLRLCQGTPGQGGRASLLRGARVAAFTRCGILGVVREAHLGPARVRDEAACGAPIVTDE